MYSIWTWPSAQMDYLRKTFQHAAVPKAGQDWTLVLVITCEATHQRDTQTLLFEHTINIPYSEAVML